MICRARAADACVSAGGVVGATAGWRDFGDKTGRDDEKTSQDDRRQRRELRFELQLLHPLLKAGLEVIGAFPGFIGVQPGIDLPGLLLVFQVLGPMIPIADLFGEAVLHRRLGFGDQLQFAGSDLLEMLGTTLAMA